jgi:hypothetical protein
MVEHSDMAFHNIAVILLKLPFNTNQSIINANFFPMQLMENDCVENKSN